MDSVLPRQAGGTSQQGWQEMVPEEIPESSGRSYIKKGPAGEQHINTWGSLWSRPNSSLPFELLPEISPLEIYIFYISLLSKSRILYLGAFRKLQHSK